MNLAIMSTTELVNTYNAAATKLGDKPIKRFQDKPTAIKRTKQILSRAQFTKVPATKRVEDDSPAPRQRKKRGMRFVFPASGDIKKHRPNTNRATLVKLTTKGATFDECLDATWRDAVEEDGTPWTQEKKIKTCYEGLRLLHYYLGYGMKQDEEGRITIHEA